MNNLKYRAIGAAFDFLSLSRIPRLIRRFDHCKGLIFTLHRVLPDAPARFAPNSILQITPDFLDTFLDRAKSFGFDLVSLDEALNRVASTTPVRPFITLTFDDAYRDNLTHALPVLRKHDCPFTLYVPTAFIDGEGEIWWQALEDIIAKNDTILLGTRHPDGRVETASLEQKTQVFKDIYWQMRTMPEPERVAFIRDLALDHDYDLYAQCRHLIMNWKELDTFVREPLCTIGAHTVRHYELAKLPEAEARREIANSISMLATKTGTEPRHLSYPIGASRSAAQREFTLAAELGLRSAVTTRPGGLYAAHNTSLHSLPRVSLNGNYQKARYVDVFLTGALFSLMGTRG